MEAAYRRHQTNLLFSGLAIMAFGLWSAIKLIMYMTLRPEEIITTRGLEMLDPSTAKVVMVVTFGIVIFFSLLVHFFIGSSAVRDARRKTKLRIPYIVLSALYVVSITMSSAQNILLLAGEGGREKLFTTFFIDATSILALVIIIVSSHKLNNIRKLQGAAAGD